MKNNFDNICIIGLGLIGGSIGLGLKKKKTKSRIVGYAKTQKTLTRAIERDLVDSVEENLNKAKELLSQEYQFEKESKTYKTKSEGFEGEDFLNQVICLITEDSAEEVVGMLKDIEKKIGRKDRSEKFSDREIDIDLLLYGKYVGKNRYKGLPKSF